SGRGNRYWTGATPARRPCARRRGGRPASRWPPRPAAGAAARNTQSWPVGGSVGAASAVAAWRRRRGQTTSTISTSPASSAPASSANSRAAPRQVSSTVKPRSTRTGSRLSALNSTPARTNSRASKTLIRRIRSGSCEGSREAYRSGGGSSALGGGRIARVATGIAGVDAVSQLLAGLEMGNVLAGQRHRFPGLGVAAHARRTEMQGEAAEATDLDALALGQGTAHHLEQGLDRQVHVVGLEVGLATRQHFDQLGLGHLRTIPRIAEEARPGRTRAALAAAITRPCSAVRAAGRPAWWYRRRRRRTC